MSIRTKTVMMIVITLVLGVALGALINPLSTDSQHRGRSKRTPRDFFNYLNRIIEPEEIQKAAMNALYDEYEQRLIMNERSYHVNAHTLFDSLYADLEPILNAEQNQKLEEKRKRWREKREKRLREADGRKDD